jgi:two-component system cell cycle response regulator DivK
MKLNILYIEDHPDNMTLVRRVVQASDYTLTEAWTGLQGILMAESQKVDLILLDINLPDIDGYEVVRRLRASSKPSVAQIPIIALTANALKGDTVKALNAGCDGYISKPFDIQDLLDKIKDFVSASV